MARPLDKDMEAVDQASCKTFFRRNTDVFQGKMVQRSVKRSAVRVRWELSDTP